ncbi:MAG: TonB-dependent receptor, partial [Candidatus Acidiferrum sp.]
GLDATLAALPGPTQLALLGNPDFQSEHVIAYEAGYRTQATENFSLDVSLFVNDYRSLESVESLPPFFNPDFVPPLTVVPMTFGNKLYGTTEGVELSGKWKVTGRWTLSPGYSFLEMHLHTQANSLDTTSLADIQGSNPGQQAQLRSHVDLAKNLAWDTNAYYVGRLPAQFVASYTRLDSLLTWRPRERIEFSVVGQNLLSDHHTEFNDQFQSVNSSEMKRSAYAKFTWHF